MVLQLNVLAEPIPWWLPPLTIGCGLLFLGPPQVDRWLHDHLGVWRSVRPAPFRVACLFVLFVGATLVGWATLGTSRWQYAQYLLLVGRAVEGATVINIFVKAQDLFALIANARAGGSTGASSGSSKWQILAEKITSHVRKRIPRIVATTLVVALSMALLSALVVSRPDQRLLVQIVLVYTLFTFALSVIGTAWVLKRLSGHLDPLSFVGIPLCVAGGELYNVPAAFDLFATQALGGPLSGATPAVFSTVGWTAGALSAVGLLWWSLRSSN